MHDMYLLRGRHGGCRGAQVHVVEGGGVAQSLRQLNLLVVQPPAVTHRGVPIKNLVQSTINVIYFIMNIEGARSALILLVILLGITISAQVILFAGFWWLANDSL